MFWNKKNKELVTVEGELNFAELYMSLIKMRFEDSIVFTVPDTVFQSRKLRLYRFLFDYCWKMQ